MSCYSGIVAVGYVIHPHEGFETEDIAGPSN